MFFSRKQKVYLSQVFTFTFHMLCDALSGPKTTVFAHFLLNKNGRHDFRVDATCMQALLTKNK